MLINCLKCNNQFQAFPSEIKVGFAKYCSRKCFDIGRIISVDKNCLVCKKKFNVFPSQIKNGGGRYCSRKCYFERNGKRNKNICLMCNKIFFSSPSNPRKYCSHLCSSQKPAYNANPIYKNCLVCKIKFRTILAKPNNKYCSKNCYLIYHSSKMWSMGICRGCKKEFKFRTARHQTCCSLSCNMLWRIQLQNLDKRVKKKCLQCKEIFLVRQHKLKEGKGKFCKKKCYAIWMSENIIGEKANGWKGGVTRLQKKIRTLYKYRCWQEKIKERDKKCIFCSSVNNLEVDHFPTTFAQILKDHRILSTQDAILCEELWKIENGRLLCHDCHKKTKTYGYSIRIKNILKINHLD